ncbi:MAG: polysaccharide deacetylase family protein [Candidatus Sulfotelmatobacter sp.]|jgi:peptidoglycan/xylan/chitin deacetylase (PgdA/CDA1 family)
MSFRFDRFATLYVVNPLRRSASADRPSIPILMYHSISDDAESGVHPYYRTSTSPQQFALQMQYLYENGFRTASLPEAVTQLRGEAAGKGKNVVITFDDGYRDFYREAFPVLSRLGFSATMFLPTSFIGEQTLQFKSRECMTWGEVRELQKSGIAFGSHTVTHPQLHALSMPAINEEITSSKQTIEQKLGCAADGFAYPYAFPQTDRDFTMRLCDSLRQAGYRNGVCTIVGRANRRSEPLFMERLPVNSCDDAPLFQAKLAGAYDWVAKSQYLAKKGKSYLRSSAGARKCSVSKDFPCSS